LKGCFKYLFGAKDALTDKMHLHLIPAGETLAGMRKRTFCSKDVYIFVYLRLDALPSSFKNYLLHTPELANLKALRHKSTHKPGGLEYQ
jgi:hypothetical protein